VGADCIDYPFGRPNTPAAAPKKQTAFKKPSDTWAMTDCDLQLFLSFGITSASYQNYVALALSTAPRNPRCGTIFISIGTWRRIRLLYKVTLAGLCADLAFMPARLASSPAAPVSLSRNARKV